MAGHPWVGTLLSSQALRTCLADCSKDALRTIIDPEAVLQRLWAAVAVFAERMTPSDGALRAQLLQHVAAAHDAAVAALGGPGKRAAAALVGAEAALVNASQHQTTLELDAARSRLLSLLGISEQQAAQLSSDLTVSDAIVAQLVAAAAVRQSDDMLDERSSASAAWSEVCAAARRVRAVTTSACFAARLQAVQHDAAAAVEARRDSALQLGYWRYRRPQVGQGPRRSVRCSRCHCACVYNRWALLGCENYYEQRQKHICIDCSGACQTGPAASGGRHSARPVRRTVVSGRRGFAGGAAGALTA